MCQKKIMRKRSHESFVEEPPKKRVSRGGNCDTKKIAPGEVLTDLTGKQWKVGKVIGRGGFGEIYLASDNLQGPVKSDAPFVVKIEEHNNGPLFVEINCLLRIGKIDTINEWKKNNNIDYLGMPNYIASGSHKIDGERLRFLILPRYDQDIEKILNKNNNKFNLKTVIVICTQLLDILEYIHSKGYVHCDIKASNILYSLQNNFNQTQMEIKPEMNIRNIHRRQCNPHRQCRKNQYTSVICSPHNLRKITTINYNESFDEIIEIYDQPPEIPKVENKNGKIHLLDYGLATKYRLSDGQHRQYCNDERKAHAGTILFCSLDAHLGAQSRRSDLESLGYNMIYWLTSRLPWEEHIENPEIVQKEKQKHFQDLDKFLKTCFDNDYPQFVYNYFEYVKYLTFESKPDYKHFKNLLTEALGMYGYKKDDCLDFDNLEGWGKKPKLKKKVCNLNLAVPSGRTPLASNTVIKRPMLRGKKRKQKKINWSEILSKNPEELLRQHNKNEVVNKPRDRKITDPSENTLQNLDIWKLNPTYAMIEVYNKLKDRNGNYNGASMKNSKSIGDCIEHVDGNTHAMNLVLSRMNERKLKENCEEQILSTRRRLVRNNSKKTSIEVKRSRSSPTFIKEVKSKGKPSLRTVRRYGLKG